MTSKPWAIVNEDEKSRNNRKSAFRNAILLLPAIPKSSKVPDSISISIVDAMRIVRMVPVTGLPIRTFKSWADKFVQQLKAMPGKTMHVLFDNYSYEYNVPSKKRGIGLIERRINDINQELPPAGEWGEFLANDKNKFQLVNILVDHIIRNGDATEKNIYVNNGPKCFFKG